MPATPASFYLQNVSTSNRIAETTKALDVYITGSAAARVSDVRESIAKCSKARTSRGFCAFSIGGWDYPTFQAGFGQLLLQKKTASKYQKRLGSCTKRRKLSSARAGAPGPNDLIPDYEERVATLDDPHHRLERFLSFHTIEQLKHRAYGAGICDGIQTYVVFHITAAFKKNKHGGDNHKLLIKFSFGIGTAAGVFNMPRDLTVKQQRR